MMNGPGKSDSPKVPTKSPNKVGQPAADGMEGNGLAKGNLPQQNASRTPSQNDALSAPERVRQAAKKDKQLRFTALWTFRFQVGWLWHRALSRRSQNGRVLWDRMRRLIKHWLPLPSVCHPYPPAPHGRRMRKIRSSGSVEGVMSNHDPYSDFGLCLQLLSNFASSNKSSQSFGAPGASAFRVSGMFPAAW
jgi:hypothetical protein